MNVVTKKLIIDGVEHECFKIARKDEFVYYPKGMIGGHLYKEDDKGHGHIFGQTLSGSSAYDIVVEGMIAVANDENANNCCWHELKLVKEEV